MVKRWIWQAKKQRDFAFQDSIATVDSIFEQVKIITHEISGLGSDFVEICPHKFISVIQANSKNELVKQIQSLPFCLVIFPSQLSYETSIALLKEIRQIRPDINLKILVLVASFNHQHIVSLLKYKVNGYILAPISEEKIRQFLVNSQHFFVKVY